jgi:hypothetical protein
MNTMINDKYIHSELTGKYTSILSINKSKWNILHLLLRVKYLIIFIVLFLCSCINRNTSKLSNEVKKEKKAGTDFNNPLDTLLVKNFESLPNDTILPCLNGIDSVEFLGYIFHNGEQLMFANVKRYINIADGKKKLNLLLIKASTSTYYFDLVDVYNLPLRIEKNGFVFNSDSVEVFSEELIWNDEIICIGTSDECYLRI